MVGVDEVGRGCLAGPLLVVAAKATGQLPPDLRDSKLMTRGQRLKMLDLLSNCCRFGEGWVDAMEIDSRGLAESLRLGISRALRNISANTDEEIILDGKVNYLPKKFSAARCQVDADSLVPIVSAASIYAKVTRDNFMIGLAKQHPLYRFESHVGYGTAAHISAIKMYGALDSIHRQSFAPLSQLKSFSR